MTGWVVTPYPLCPVGSGTIGLVEGASVGSRGTSGSKIVEFCRSTVEVGWTDSATTLRTSYYTGEDTQERAGRPLFSSRLKETLGCRLYINLVLF